MRDYAKVSPQFWTGVTGKALKAAGHEAVIVGLYLMTSPHATMIGVYHCPIGYMAIDTGLGLEGASKGLQCAIEAGFCTYEAASEYVWVHEFAAYQVGDTLEPKDLRCKGVANELSKVPKGECRRGFTARYAAAFHLPEALLESGAQASPSKAPSKPGAGAGAGTRAETGTGSLAPQSPAAAPAPAPAADAAPTTPSQRQAPARGSRIPDDWALPKPWGQWALKEYPHWNADVVRSIAKKFHNHWKAKSGKDATKVDWYATWQNWCMSGITQEEHPAPKASAADPYGPDWKAARDAEASRLLFGDKTPGAVVDQPEHPPANPQLTLTESSDA